MDVLNELTTVYLLVDVLHELKLFNYYRISDKDSDIQFYDFMTINHLQMKVVVFLAPWARLVTVFRLVKIAQEKFEIRRSHCIFLCSSPLNEIMYTKNIFVQ